jgi:4a-hydroxytetrahydrobiopterin dehydratase
MKTLTEEEIKKKVSEIEDWSVDGKRLVRELIFQDFISAFAFMTECAFASEKLNHHPDWCNRFDRVTIRLTTHDAGGLTELDFRLADSIDAVARRFHHK